MKNLKNLSIKNLRLKSAVAFFFLFFLHGTSIGNGQQGITYNVLRLCAAALDKLNNSAPTVQRWRKTAVIGWCGN